MPLAVMHSISEFSAWRNASHRETSIRFCTEASATSVFSVDDFERVHPWLRKERVALIDTEHAKKAVDTIVEGRAVVFATPPGSRKPDEPLAWNQGLKLPTQLVDQEVEAAEIW